MRSTAGRRRPIARCALALGSVAAVTLAAACTSGSATGGGGGGDEFSVGVPSWYFAHLTPGQAGESGIDNAIWTPLTSIDPKSGKVVDAVAQSLTSTDQRHWTIKIKSGWTFQNGEPVTAQSFADSWNATAYAPNAMADSYLLANFAGYSDLNPAKGKPTTRTMSGVQVVDTSTLKVTLTKALSSFPYLLAGTVFAPMPKAAFKNLAAYDKLPVGNGPYQVVAPGITAGGQRFTLKRFDGYAGQKGKAARIVVKGYQSNTTAFTSFESGAVDLAVVSGNDLVTAASKYPNQLVKASAPAVVYLGFPQWEKQFKDKRVREAFSLAVDRQSIVKALLQGFGVPAKDIAPSTVSGGGGSGCAYCSYDPGRAKALLAAAGGWHGSITLWTTQDDASMQTVLQAVLNQLRTNLGISSIKLQAQPTAQLYPNLTKHTVNGPFMLYMGASYPTLYSQATQLFSPGSGTNTTGYDSPAVNTALDRSARAGSPEQATKDSQQAVTTALGDLPLTPLYYPVTGLVHSKNLSNVRMESLGDAHLADITVG